MRDLLLTMEETMGQRLKRLRLEKKLTQKELAKAAGLGQSAIGNIESDTRNYGLSVVAIAKVLDTSPDYLQMKDQDTSAVPTWPFELFTPEEFMLLGRLQREEIENSIAGAIQRVQKTGLAA